MGEQPLGKPKGRRRPDPSSEAGVPADVPQAIVDEGSWTGSYFRGLVRGALRRIYFRWPGRKVALDRVRVETFGVTKSGEPTKRPAVWYRCETCGTLGKAQVAKGNPKGQVRVWVDHKDPVVPLDRYPDWNEYVNRLFCSPDNFEILCDDCHHMKSQAERQIRKDNVRRQKTPQDPPDGD
jgi:hypothetical protein